MRTVKRASSKYNRPDRSPQSATTTPRIAFAVRVRGRSNDLLVVQHCPYQCGALEHVHGACGIGSAFGAGDGHRVAHCADLDDQSRGYFVIEIASFESAAA